MVQGCASQVEQVPAEKRVRLVTASGEDLPMVDHIQVPVQMGELEVLHNFVVVESLVASIILGVDFLHDNGLVLDFTQTPVAVRHPDLPSIAQLEESMEIEQLRPVYQAAQRTQAKACMITEING